MGFGVWGLGFGVWGLGFGALGLRVSAGSGLEGFKGSCLAGLGFMVLAMVRGLGLTGHIVGSMGLLRISKLSEGLGTHRTCQISIGIEGLGFKLRASALLISAKALLL